MNTLFPVEQVLPPGFSYFPDFISEEEEAALLSDIDKIRLHAFVFQGFEAKRKVASFGFDYSFEKRNLTKGQPIPQEFNFLVNKVSQKMAVAPLEIGELLVIEYPVEAVMNWHRDAPPFDKIAGISLLSDCIFKFRPQEKAKQTRQSVISFTVKRRSLYIMQDDSRNEWQHSVAPAKKVRYSITLRTLRNK
jgi:alkylated DNA repair dioxygenase AlkB